MEERIQHKVNEIIKEEEEFMRFKIRGEMHEEHYEEIRKKARMRAIRLVNIEEEAKQRKEEKQRREEEKQRREEEKQRRQEEETQRKEKYRIEKEEEIRKIGENPNEPLTMNALYLICPGFDKDILIRACDDLNLEMVKRIARKTYPNKFK